MPCELTSTGHCTSGHLFKLQRTNELRFFQFYTGHPIYRAWRHWSSTGALATVLSALVLHAFLLGGLLQDSVGAAPSR
jgi:hypothetical protein